MSKHNGSRSLSDRRRRMKGALLGRPVRPACVDTDLTVADLVEQMSGMSLQARNIGRKPAEGRPRLKLGWKGEHLTSFRTSAPGRALVARRLR